MVVEVRSFSMCFEPYSTIQIFLNISLTIYMELDLGKCHRESRKHVDETSDIFGQVDDLCSLRECVKLCL